MFDEYFTSIYTLNNDNVQLLIFQFKTQSSLSNITCTAFEISKLIEILNPNKDKEPDNISDRMLKAVAYEISVPLSIFINSLLGDVSQSFRSKNF